MFESDRAKVGQPLRARAQGLHHEAIGARTTSLDADLGAVADEFIFGRMWTREGLEFEDRMLVAMVALAATGNTDQLRNYLHGALQDGMDADRIHEAFAMLVVYVGFPTGLSALGLLKDVRESHARWLTKQPEGGTE